MVDKIIVLLAMVMFSLGLLIVYEKFVEVLQWVL